AGVAEAPAAGNVGERLRPPAESTRVVEVKARRSEQVGPVIILELEHAPDEREAVRMDAGRGEADHGVPGRDRAAVDQLARVDDTDARPGEVELALAVDAGQLGGLAADERDAGLAADLGGTLDELCDPV